MKVAFFSSVLNHHQLPFCLELYKYLETDFVFVATMRMETQRIQLGYEDYSDKYPFCLKMYSSKNNFEIAYKLSQDCDILIAGVFPSKFLFDRLKNNKITFRYSERIFNDGFWHILSPRAIVSAYKNHFRYRGKPFYLLCASAYLPWDVSRLLSYPEKKFKWGYFPEFEKYNISDILLKKNKRVSILWAGRFLDWKQPESAIQVAKYLSDKDINYSLEMIGIGPLKNKIEQLSRELKVSQNILFSGSMPPKLVRQKMLDSNIFLFTSNHKEGWGVVLNEAMNCSCAVVANKYIGSVPYLISNGVNGLVYDDKNKDSLNESVERLILDESYRNFLSVNAYKTIEEYWNPIVASSRLINLFNSLLNDEKIIYYDSGPLSKAEIIK